MNAEHWGKIKDLLDQVLDVEPEGRVDYLKETGIDGEILAEIRSLLVFEGASEDFMSLSLTEFSKDLVADDEPETSLIGQKIGIYEITGELGFGGMGAVYLAERTDGKFSQKVALKMLKREFNVERIRRNFRREREILAKLNHPNIARLLDAGTADDGVPYLVMEYVEGIPIDEFCVLRKPSLTARLKLFNKICDAVQFAHRNLVIHRDLKPSNILVTESGEPKLLDFGISKLLDAEENPLMTAFGAMTPEYASPEQIRGETVSTASDIYSLGVVLYKILTDSLPFRSNGKTNSELLRSITEDEPNAPSAIQNSEDLRSFKGDLDNIILKSIAKEPERRYQTVEQFSGDIWRHLDGLPVLARPATRAYRLSKFYRRNKIAVTATILIFAALVAGISVALRQTGVAQANAAIAVAESDNAKAEQEKAEKVSTFMMKFIRYANPNWYAEGHGFAGEARVIDALNDMATKIDTEFADHPDVLAELHHHIGDTYNSRNDPGDAQKAKMHFQKAFQLRRAFYGGWHELLAKDMLYLYWVEPLPRSEETVQIFSDAIVMMRSTNPKNLNLPFMLEDYFHRLVDDNKSDIHETYLRHVPQPAPTDKYLAGDQLFDEMIGLLNMHYGENSPQVVVQKCEGMILKLKVNKISEAEEFYRICKEDHEYRISTGKAVFPGIMEKLAQFQSVSGKNN